MNKFHIALCATALLVVTYACASPMAIVETPSVSQTPAATRTPPPATATTQAAINVVDLLPAREELPEGTVDLPGEIASGLAELIYELQEFMDSRAVGYGSLNGEILVAEMGLLSPAMIAEFDLSVQEKVLSLLANLSEFMVGDSQTALTDNDLSYVVEIPADRMPPDVHWASNFVRGQGGLVRVDVIAFRRGSVAIFMMYISAPERGPVLDITQFTTIFEEKMRSAQ